MEWVFAMFCTTVWCFCMPEFQWFSLAVQSCHLETHFFMRIWLLCWRIRQISGYLALGLDLGVENLLKVGTLHKLYESLLLFSQRGFFACVCGKGYFLNVLLTTIFSVVHQWKQSLWTTAIQPLRQATQYWTHTQAQVSHPSTENVQNLSLYNLEDNTVGFSVLVITNHFSSVFSLLKALIHWSIAYLWIAPSKPGIGLFFFIFRNTHA